MGPVIAIFLWMLPKLLKKIRITGYKLTYLAVRPSGVKQNLDCGINVFIFCLEYERIRLLLPSVSQEKYYKTLVGTESVNLGLHQITGLQKTKYYFNIINSL